MGRKRRVTGHINPSSKSPEYLVICYICKEVKNRPLIKDGIGYKHDTCIRR